MDEGAGKYECREGLDEGVVVGGEVWVEPAVDWVDADGQLAASVVNVGAGEVVLTLVERGGGFGWGPRWALGLGGLNILPLMTPGVVARTGVFRFAGSRGCFSLFPNLAASSR